jgi:TrmH family RNA methyltransferase
MLNKNEVKYIQSLCHKKQRQESGLFIAEGVKLVNELMRSKLTIKKLYATEDWETEVSCKVETVRVTMDELKKISTLQTPNKVLALVEEPILPKLKIAKNSWVLALDDIQDPGNMGTLIRIADWFGINTIVASKNSVDCFNNKVVQSTMGSIGRVKVHYVDLPDFLVVADLPVFGALLEGKSVFNTTIPNGGILLIGNESKGIHPNCRKLITNPISIPRIGGAESLNAGVAAGILLSYLTKK